MKNILELDLEFLTAFLNYKKTAVILIIISFLLLPFPVQAESITVLTPNGGVCLDIGTSYNITWSGSGSSHYAIYRSTDTASRTTNAVLIAEDVTGNSYSWTVPSSPSTPVAIWVELHNPSHQVLAMDGSDSINGIPTTSCSPVNYNHDNTDTTAPTVPTNLRSTVSGSQVTLNWEASTDNIGVTGYKIYRNGSYLTSVNSTTFSEYSLSPGTYTFSVAAFDAAGNISAQSSLVNVTITATSISVSLNFTVDGSEKITRSVPASFSLVWTSSNATSCNASGNWPSEGKALWGNQSFTVSTAGIYNYTLTCSNGSGSVSKTVYVEVRSETLETARFQVSGWGLSVDNNLSTIGFAISSALDVNSVNDSSVFVKKISDNSLVPATVSVESYGLRLITSQPLQPGIAYSSVVKSSVRNTNNIQLTEDYVCNFTALLSGHYTACPGTTSQPPPPVADATVYGIVTDSSGQAVSSAGVHIFNAGLSYNFGIPTRSDGSFSLSLPAADYQIEVFPPPSSNLIKPAPQGFSVAAGENKQINLQFLEGNQTNKIITGIIAFSTGLAVTDAEAGAYSETSGQWASTFTDTNGAYTLRVGSGKYKVSFRPKNAETALWQWPGVFEEASFSDEAVAETKTLNFTVNLAGAKVIVSVANQDGLPLSGAGVILDYHSASSLSGETYLPSQFRKTDSTGTATFLVTAGTYYLRAYLPAEQGYLNPPEQRVEIAGSDEQKFNLVFRKPEVVNSIMAKGLVKFSDGSPVAEATVWAWSDQGGANRTATNNAGEFILPLSSQTRWHLGAGKEVSGFPYKSAKAVIEGNIDSFIELILIPITLAPLPPLVNLTKPATEHIIVQTKDGAEVAVPPTVAASSGSISVELKPTIEAASQANARLIGTVYDVTVKDEGGQNITQLNGEIEITFPYGDGYLRKNGFLEDKLTPSYYDDTTGVWVKLDNFTVDKERNIIIVRVKHLTRFALVAPADTIAPVPPSNAVSWLSGKQEISLAWIDPQVDFHHTNVYRSEKRNVRGELVGSLVTSGSFVDKNLVLRKTYYYTLVSIDAAGNESEGSVKITRRLTGRVQKAPKLKTDSAQFKTYLSRGRKGSSVRTLQVYLQLYNYYPASLELTSIYDDLTVQAVKDFQKSKALKQTGTLDTRTRAELNKL